MAVVQNDDFTGIAAGSGLATRVAPAGGMWRNLTGGFVGVGPTGTDRVRNSGTGVVYLDGTLGLDTYRVEADILVVTDNNAAASGVVAYLEVATGNFYHARLQSNGNNIQLYRFTGTTTAALLDQTPVGSFTLTAGAVHRLMLEVAPGVQKVYVDDTLHINWTDAALTVAGHAGVRGAGSSSDTTALHTDNFAVDDLQVAASTARLVMNL